MVGVDEDTLELPLEVFVAVESPEPLPDNPVAVKYTNIKIKLPARINKPAIINPSFVNLGPPAFGIWGGGT